jgi:hypothetical protein
MFKIRRQTFTRFLSSVVLLMAMSCTGQTRDIPLGLVLLQTVGVDQDGSSKMSPGIIVRFISKVTKAEIFAITNEVGFAEVPLRPGIYCYDAFSNKGKGLAMKRPASERCFEVKPFEDAEIGVEFIK